MRSFGQKEEESREMIAVYACHVEVDEGCAVWKAEFGFVHLFKKYGNS